MMSTLARRIRKRRCEAGLTQADLADILGKSGQGCISRWELGHAAPRWGDLVKLASIFGQTPSAFLRGVRR